MLQTHRAKRAVQFEESKKLKEMAETGETTQTRTETLDSLDVDHEKMWYDQQLRTLDGSTGASSVASNTPTMTVLRRVVEQKNKKMEPSLHRLQVVLKWLFFIVSLLSIASVTTAVLLFQDYLKDESIQVQDEGNRLRLLHVRYITWRAVRVYTRRTLLSLLCCSNFATSVPHSVLLPLLVYSFISFHITDDIIPTDLFVRSCSLGSRAGSGFWCGVQLNEESHVFCHRRVRGDS